LEAEKKNVALIRAHAILMSIAWLVFASLGMFIARYMKPAWGDLYGKKAWFQVHRFLMFSTLVVTVVGVVLAFVFADGWTKADDAHPIIGIIVLVLTVIQPVMAYFRPAPGDDSRFLFNMAHRSVGLSALLLAVVNCFLGVLLPHFDIKIIGLYPLIAYCIGVFLVLLFEVALMFLAKPSYDLDQPKAEMKDGKVQVETKKPAKPANQNKLERKIMFAFVFVVVSGSCLALIILLAGI